MGSPTITRSNSSSDASSGSFSTPFGTGSSTGRTAGPSSSSPSFSSVVSPRTTRQGPRPPSLRHLQRVRAIRPMTRTRGLVLPLRYASKMASTTELACFLSLSPSTSTSTGVCSCCFSSSIILSALACPARVFTSKISCMTLSRCSSLRPRRSSRSAPRRSADTRWSPWKCRRIFASWFLVGLCVLWRNSSTIEKIVASGILSMQSQLLMKSPSISMTAMSDSGWSRSFSTSTRRFSTASRQLPTWSFTTFMPISVSSVHRKTTQRLRRATGPRPSVAHRWLLAGCDGGHGILSIGKKT
mmetsp:Transcript_30741/g.86704  ORF Transcript_30741/g.86704 Transcript_30741/m.86704 type:complete len:299 (+) Transcript_30741:1330-2226(+)